MLGYGSDWKDGIRLKKGMIITSRKIKLETCGWSQIVEKKEILLGLTLLLNYDSPLFMLLHVRAAKKLLISSRIGL